MKTTMGTNSLRLGATGQSGFRFDSVSVHARLLDAAKSTTYAYNTSNQLTSSVTNGTTTSCTYDASGQPPANAAYSYLALDHLSSTRGVFSQTKTQTGTMEFLPYGARHTATGTLPHHQFTAKPYDTGTGLYNFPYRHYSPAMARWTGADPAGIVDGPNVYGYVRGHSITHNDPMGEFTLRIPPTGPYDKEDCISGWERCRAGGYLCFMCLMKCTAQGEWPAVVPDVWGCDHSCGPGPEKKSDRRGKC